jgi:hypothetical protein
VIEEKFMLSSWFGKPEGKMPFEKPRHRGSCIFKSTYSAATLIIFSLSKINVYLPGISVVKSHKTVHSFVSRHFYVLSQEPFDFNLQEAVTPLSVLTFILLRFSCGTRAQFESRPPDC